MIQYNELRIADNNLIIDFEIEKETYYKGVTITGLKIQSSKDNSIDQIVDIADNQTSYKGSIFVPEANSELLIITPLVTPLTMDTPCGKDIVDKAAIYNKKSILDKGLSYLKELGNTCSIPKGLVDFILKLKALDIAIATCNYTEAIKYWKMLNRRQIKTATNNCGCHGFN